MIEIVNLCKSFGGHPVLDNLNLNIESGETMVIIGREAVGMIDCWRQRGRMTGGDDDGRVCTYGRRSSIPVHPFNLCILDGARMAMWRKRMWQL